MPADDLILNVRQIAGYPPTGVQFGQTVLVQQDGLGSAYAQMDLQTLVADALLEAGPMQIGLPSGPGAATSSVFVNTVTTAAIGFNAYDIGSDAWLYYGATDAGLFQWKNGEFSFWGAPPGPDDPGVPWEKILTLELGGDAILAGSLTLGAGPQGPMGAATAEFVAGAVAALQATTVWTVNGRRGDVVLSLWDIPGAAPIWSPRFQGRPMAPTPDVCDCSGAIATTAWVQRHVMASLGHYVADRPFVFTFNGRAGNIVLTEDDIVNAGGGAVFNDTALTGVPTAPTAAPGTDSSQLATTAYVDNAVAGGPFAPILSPTFSGYPSAPTAEPGTSTAQIATTAFVQAAIVESTTGVASFNGRTGAVTLTQADVTGAGGATLVSPAFTGSPTAPTQAPGTSNTTLATTAYVLAAITGAGNVSSFNTRTGAITLTAADLTAAGGALLASPAFTGTPSAPTATAGTSTAQLATTQFVMTQIAGYVSSFNGRGGAVTLTANDVSAAGALVNPSPALTGVPTAPTASQGANSTQIATTAFVVAAMAAGGGVDSFNGRAGAVTLTSTDLTNAGGALASALANYLPLAGGTLSGNLVIALAAAGSQLLLNKPVGAFANSLVSEVGGLSRWSMLLGNGNLETGSNVGTDFNLLRFDDTGTISTSVIQIIRSTGNVFLPTGPFIIGKAQTTSLNNIFGMSFGSNGLLIEQPGAAASQCLSLTRTAAGNGAIFYMNSAAIGSISLGASSVSYNTTSDTRLKADLRSFDAGAILDQIEVWDFTWLRTGRRGHGVVAQDVNEVYPEAVTFDEREDWWGTDYSKFVPLLLQEVKALRARVSTLEARP